MDMPNHSQYPRSATLSLPPEEHWTIHHVLLDRIEQGSTAEKPMRVEPPPAEVVQAFETLDSGETSFSLPQLEAMQTVLAEYHHSTRWWVLERARIEQLLHRVTECIEKHRAASPVD
jgi:hypothetical protein